MTVILSLIFLITGVVLLYYGAERLIKGSVGLAHQFNVSKLVVGLTIVSFGTSLPELVVTVLAALYGNTDIAVGNVIGSNIANVGLILGLTAVTAPIAVQVSTVRRELPMMIAATIVFTVMVMQGALTFVHGIVLLTALAAYTWLSYSLSKKESATITSEISKKFDDSPQSIKPTGGINFIWVGIGLLTVIGGAELLVRASVEIARIFEVSEKLIGLTVVAVGTSLPELATSVVAAFKKESDIALGNVVGSNVFNILGIIGVAALLRPLNIHQSFTVDIIVMVSYSLLLFPLTRIGLKVTRLEGLFLVVSYVGYIVWLAEGG